MRFLVLAVAILSTVCSEQLRTFNKTKIPFFISSHIRLNETPNVRSVDVKCYNDLGNIIYNLIPRKDIPEMELHVTCHTKVENVFRVVGDDPKPLFNCLENVTTVVNWLGIFSKNAKTLDLSNNCIRDVNVLPNLQTLTILILKHNSIEFIEKGAFANLEKLEILDLSYNSLTGERLSSEIFQGNCELNNNQNETQSGNTSLEITNGCKQMEVRFLNLGHNNIKSLHPQTFKHMHNLRELHLNHNPLSIADPNIITALKSIPLLQALHLSNLHLSSIPYSLVDGLKLKALYLNSNNFTEVPEELSFLGRSLQYLNINDNPVQTLNFDSFIGLNNLKELEIAGMPELTSVFEGAFSHLRSLEIIILSYNPKLSFIDPFAFRWTSASPCSVKKVYLQENNLKHLSEHLLPWSQLETIILSGNQWACDCKLRWFLEMTERRNLKVMRDSELKCSHPNWPNITTYDTYNRPIRNFRCAHPVNYSFSTYTPFTMVERLVIVIFLTAISLLIGIGLFRCVYRITNKREARVEDLFTLSSSVNDLKYYRLRNKPIYNDITCP